MLCSVGTMMHLSRILTGMSAAEFGKQLNMSQATVAAWEGETRTIPVTAVPVWAEKIMDYDATEYILQYHFDNFVADLTATKPYSYFFGVSVVQELNYLLENSEFLSDRDTEYQIVPLVRSNKIFKEILEDPDHPREDGDLQVTSSLSLAVMTNLMYHDKKELCNILNKHIDIGENLMPDFFRFFIYFMLKRTFFEVYGQDNKIMGDILECMSLRRLLGVINKEIDNGNSICVASKRSRADFFNLLFTGFSFINERVNRRIVIKGVSGREYVFGDIKR